MSKSFFILLGYVTLTIMIILVTVGLVAYGQGYSYDFLNQRFVHNGLVILDSVPSGATVKIDGKRGSKKTPYHGSFEEGEQRFTVSRPGYEAWTKVLRVVASQVTLAEYIVLIPQQRTETILDRQIQISSQTITRDRRQMAYIVPGPTGGLYVLDLMDTRPARRLYQPPTTTDPALAETLRDVQWSDDASHLLLGSAINGVYTSRLVTTSDGSQVNLTERFKFDFSTLRFSSRDWRQLYWLSPEGIRRLDAGANTVTGILADKVSQFEVAGERILYVQTSELGESLGALDARDRKSTIIPALVKSPSYVIKYERYRGQDLLAVVPSSTRTGTMYLNIFSTEMTTKEVAQDVTSIIYSEDGHLATFYSPTKLVSYDLEQSGIFARSVSYSASFKEADKVSALNYYDGYHLLLNQNGRLIFVDYDGTNRVDLGPIIPGVAPHRIADQRLIMVLATVGSEAALKSISIK